MMSHFISRISQYTLISFAACYNRFIKSCFDWMLGTKRIRELETFPFCVDFRIAEKRTEQENKWPSSWCNRRSWENTFQLLCNWSFFNTSGCEHAQSTSLFVLKTIDKHLITAWWTNWPKIFSSRLKLGRFVTLQLKPDPEAELNGLVFMVIRCRGVISSGAGLIKEAWHVAESLTPQVCGREHLKLAKREGSGVCAADG